MKTITQNFCWPALLMMLGTALVAKADDTVGIANLSDFRNSDVVLGQSPEGEATEDHDSQGSSSDGYVTEGYCPEGGYYVECPPYYGPAPFVHHSVLSNNCIADCLRGPAMNFRMRTQIAGETLKASCHQTCREREHWFRNKFGYFFPTGCCGRGCPPIGHYNIVYPLDPNYFDQRDGNIYAAQGYGGPVSVPLAPNVRHAYNYGWGVPSSRLTPISHPYPGP